jgi:hypothetical protein
MMRAEVSGPYEPDQAGPGRQYVSEGIWEWAQTQIGRRLGENDCIVAELVGGQIVTCGEANVSGGTCSCCWYYPRADSHASTQVLRAWVCTFTKD